MKRLLFITAMLLCSATQAQNYESLYGETYIWNNDTEAYDLESGSWGSIYFMYTDEYIQFQFGEDEPRRLWWVLHSRPNDDCECYYTEADALKICIDTEKRRMRIYSKLENSRFQEVWVLTKIQDVD
tara:strand:+ start:181 stop:561 length:381 start_codon:yes stop_codon:yes gene_type:complete